MSKYNVQNSDGKVLNLDGPLTNEEAFTLADKIEAEHNIEVMVVVVVTSFRFATDSEVGTIESTDFEDACLKLRAMLPAAAVADGAWGWVEDTDGIRYKIGC